MARGIEELAEMQVTGPVQGGDMVMKPDQAPVGAAALLSKMAKKNTPGIFKLPMPDKEMPNFMKVAAEGVEQQTAQGDTINIMAGELMRQGIDIRGKGMDEIIQIYEQTFGSPGDVDQFGISKVDPSDWRSILKMIQSGMSSEEIDAQIAAAKFPGNFTDKEQNVVELPRNLKTGPDNPETELAYITPDEQALLAFMNPGTPHVGPENVPTYDEGDYLEDIGYSRQEVERQQERAPTIDTSTREGQQQRQDFRDRTGSDVVTEDELRGRGIERGSSEFQKLTAAPAGGKDTTVVEDSFIESDSGSGNVDLVQDLISKINNSKTSQEVKTLLNQGKTMGSDVLNKIFSGIDNSAKKLAGFFDTKPHDGDDDGETKEQKEWQKYVNSILKGASLPAIGGMAAVKEIGKMLHDFKLTPEKLQDENYLAIMKDVFEKQGGFEGKEGRTRWENFKKKHGDVITEAFGKVDPMRELEARLKGAVAPKGSEAYKRTQPEEYWKEYKGRSMGDMEELSKLSLSGASPELSRQIIEAREITSREKDAQEGRDGRGYGGGADVIEEKLDEIVSTTDPRAGQFSLGGTMPYTHDVATGGVEMDVPLGRRFAIDKGGKYRGTTGGMGLNEAMQYATLGGYGQLEPFQEYLTRRRKHLGEDEPQYFDEEGNVIYSGIE